ncbi:MAG: hydantoinase B/oxoprolinase family protein, partial [Planctomycetes bacterium]|nr:hydantoinase B/oxoprolinase family protein [Planctomycetota bacterium]
TDLIAEGLVIPPVLFERDADIVRDVISIIRANTRTPEERTGDLLAQLFSCDRGISRLLGIERRMGSEQFTRLSEKLIAHSRALMRHSLAKLKPGVYRAEDMMDDDGAGATDIPIKVALTVKRGQLIFDFTGSAPQVRGGINAVLAVTQSACYYAALCFCDPVPPVNAGCFECIKVIAPEGTIVNARRPAAVAGGNVETSQRIVDVCLGALSQAASGRGCAQSQGTMNNVTIGGGGDKPFTYYETIAGGCGATREHAGASATHSHMTNTLNTPIEALEHAYPLRVEEYSLRGGRECPSHQQKGGAGVTRRIRALVPCEFGFLTERRKHAPRGLHGATDGDIGDNTLMRAGKKRNLPPKCSGRLETGDTLEIKTPSGGCA